MAMRPTNSSVQRSSTTKRCARKTIGFDRSKPRNIVSKSVAKKNVSRYSNIVCETIDSESSGDDASDDTENISRDKDNKKNTDRKKGRYSSKKSSVVESSGNDEKELSADDDDESTESECNDHNEIDKNKKTIKQKRANKTSKSKKKRKSKKKDKSKQKGKSKKKVIGQKRKFRCKQLKFRSGKKQRIDSRYKKKYAKDFILKLNPYTDIRCKVKFYAPEKHAPKLVASYYDKHPDSDRDSDVNETLFYGEMKVDKKTNSKRIELFCYCDANMVIGSKGRGDDDYFCNACNKRIPRNTSFLFCTQSMFYDLFLFLFLFLFYYILKNMYVHMHLCLKITI